MHFINSLYIAVPESQQTLPLAANPKNEVVTSRSTEYRRRKRRALEATEPLVRKSYACSICGGKLTVGWLVQ